MADNATQYKVELSTIETIPEIDGLVSGVDYVADTVKLAEAGEYERGELLMSGSDGFVKATAEGVSSAAELAILAQDIIVPSESYAVVTAYFRGTFSAGRVILPYEGDIEDARPAMRRHGLFLV